MTGPVLRSDQGTASPRAVLEWRVVPARSAADFRVARRLIEEYATSLGMDMCFEKVAEELRTLRTMYGPPNGRLFLARQERRVAGCAALRRFDEDRGEVKRVYVRPEFRGAGLGRRLVGAVLDSAAELGYRSVVLDTLPAMTEATALYRRLGFREIPAYYQSPAPGTRYFGRILAESSGTASPPAPRRDGRSDLGR